MEGIVEYCVQHTDGRGLVKVSSFFHLKSWDVNPGWEVPVNQQILKNDHMWQVEKSETAFQVGKVIWTKHRGQKDHMVRELSSPSWLEPRVWTVAGSFPGGLR